MMDDLKQKAVGALRWSEKYTKTDMVYLAKGGGWLMVGRAISMLSVFLLSVAFANLLPKETYGMYKYIISVVSLLGLFTLSGMGTAVSQSVARGFEGTLKPAIRAEIRWGLIGGLLALLMGLYYLVNHSNMLAICFGMVGLILPFTNVYYLYSFVLQGRKMFDRAVKYDSLVQITYTLAAFAALVLTRNLYVMLVVYLLSLSLFQYVTYRLVKKGLGLNDKIDPAAVGYGKHLSLMGVLGLATLADQILVYHLLGPVQLAIYAMAIAPPEQLKGVLKMVMQLALPKFATQTKEMVKAAVFRKIWVFSAFISLGVVVYIFFAPIFYGYIFPKYLESIVLSQIYVISLIASAALLPVSAFQAVGATKELYKLNLSGTVIQLILLIVGIYFWGLPGAIAARATTRFMELFYALWLIKRLR
jgi:O-antigen/teichoic acid export membrane protein